MLRKNKVVTPEVKVEQANLQVEAQQSQFTLMVGEVANAIEARKEAIEELNKEVESLLAQVEVKSQAIDKAEVQNKLDDAYIARLRELLGN
jgi:uncharacterized protein YhaN